MLNAKKSIEVARSLYFREIMKLPAQIKYSPMNNQKKEVKKKLNAVKPLAGATQGSARYYLAGVLAITLIVFLPAIQNLFITFDDTQYVVENQFITGFSALNIRTILSGDANHLGNYHPVTLLSYVVNYSFSALNPAPYHLTNILLHLLNTLLVFQLSLLLFTRIGSDHRLVLSAVTALLFGIHPLHVESVAWVSGRKDLLYTCFYLLSLISYLRYVDKKKISGYLPALLFFVLSLLSKGMAVTLPLALIALDYLLKRDLRDKKVILEKVPFLLLSLFFGIIAVVVQHAQGATDIVQCNFLERLVFSSFGFTQYLIKLAIPYKLCGYYPYPDYAAGHIPWYYFLCFIPVLVTGFLLVYYWFARSGRAILFGCCFFIINIMFVIQLFPVGSAVMADRYTYLSSFGLFFLFAWGMGLLMKRFNLSKTLVFGIFILYAGLLSVTANQRCSVWKDSYSFWTDVMEKYPYFYPAINNLAVFKEKDGKPEEALELSNQSIRVNKFNPNAWFQRGSIEGKNGNYQQAIADFDTAIRYSPRYVKVYINRAIAKAMIKDYRGALSDLNWVLGVTRNEEAYFNRGILNKELKNYPQAISDFQEAISLDASCLKCYYSLGLSNYFAGRFLDAMKSFSACIDRDPAAGMAFYYRGLSGIQAGLAGNYCDDLQRAVSMGVKEAEPFRQQYCPQ